ncbi:MAG: IgGFc-binding protein, partial [Bacteroidetes bacterium]|nr:IgGFc-binding protein [Bacteroidota bacterium]
MKKFSLGNIVLLIIAFFAIQTCFSQLSKTHYIPPLTAAEFGNANPEDQYFYISTPSLTDVAYTIKKVGLSSSFDITGIVSNTNPQRIDLDPGFGQLFIPSNSTGQIVNSRGFIIEASDLIYVSVRMNAGGGAQAGALVSKGLSALGTEFRVGTFTNENPQNNYLNFVSVMATEDGTQVTFDDLPVGMVVKNYSGTFPINATLNKGESFTVATNSFDSPINRDGLIGTWVKSNNPIAVNCGSANGSFHNGGGRDYGIDQIVGADKIGSEYIFVRGDGNNDWENVLIVAHSNNTSITLNNDSGPVATINTGEYYLIEGDQFSANGNMYVKTTEPAYAYQGVGGSGEANQGMFFVPPLDCETRGNVDNIAQINEIGNTSYQGGVTIVTKQGATVKINGSPITGTAYPVDGKSTYITYKVLGLTGNTSVQCDDELYCAYFNSNGSATSGSFYSGFPTAPEINFEADFVTLGNCIDNVTLEAANMGAFESIEWYYDDGAGGGFIPTGVHDKTITPTFPGESSFSTGTYKIVGITCKGDKIHSDEIPISICPDDTDDDGIIDNLDIDNDNDGILNCTESYGDQIVNLTNPLNGSLPIGGYTYTGDITPIGDNTNTLIGGSDGTFKSTVASKNGLVESSLDYELLFFNNDLNIKVELADNSNLGNSVLTDEDEFVIKVTNDKTITLIDPDDQLLVDTNYDGVFESGITQFSSYEIHFKIKGTSLAIGAGTFRFVSSMINSFTYNHKNISDTNSNSAAFKITATCVPLDTDQDGLNDDFDFDSENDGIPDRAECTGT